MFGQLLPVSTQRELACSGALWTTCRWEHTALHCLRLTALRISGPPERVSSSSAAVDIWLLLYMPGQAGAHVHIESVTGRKERAGNQSGSTSESGVGACSGPSAGTAPAAGSSPAPPATAA